jgi:hypothetical protein
MTASTENHSFDQKAQPTTSLPGLDEKVQPEPSTDEPEALASEPEAQHDAGHDSVSSPILPSSKARSIALVATVTGATFLNVNLHQVPFERNRFLNMGYRHLPFNQLSSYFQLLRKL